MKLTRVTALERGLSAVELQKYVTGPVPSYRYDN
jgi:hypothetical protein